MENIFILYIYEKREQIIYLKYNYFPYENQWMSNIELGYFFEDKEEIKRGLLEPLEESRREDRRKIK
jgi:hypothetical protein